MALATPLLVFPSAAEDSRARYECSFKQYKYGEDGEKNEYSQGEKVLEIDLATSSVDELGDDYGPYPARISDESINWEYVHELEGVPHPFLHGYSIHRESLRFSGWMTYVDKHFFSGTCRHVGPEL